MSIGLQIYTIIHVVLSLAGIGSGFVVFYGLLTDKRLEAWTGFFLVTTVTTSGTGFFFPVDRFLPSHALGITSLLVLAVATAALPPRPGGGMALAVRGRRRRSPVSERVRADRPVVWKGTGLEGPAAQQSGIRTTHGADALHRRGCFGGAPLPRPLASTILARC